MKAFVVAVIVALFAVIGNGLVNQRKKKDRGDDYDSLHGEGGAA